jgi:uncharacterized membrane protein YbhN (UPF0104 family)
MPGRRVFLLLAGAALGALFLGLAVRRLDWHAAYDALAGARPREIAAVLCCLAAYYGIKALRWRFLVAPFAAVTALELLPAVLAGLAGNYVFPHVGEIARAVLVSRRIGVPAGALLGSIAIERFFDFLALLAIVLAVLLPLGAMNAEVRTASLFVAVLSVALLAAVVLFLFRAEACLALVRRLLEPWAPRLAAFAGYHLGQVRVGLGAIGDPRLLVPVFALSVLQWIVIVGCVEFSLRAVGVAAPFAGSVSVLLLNVIGLTLPAAPGHIGTVQIAFIAGLAPFGIAKEQVFAASVVYNCLMVVPTVVLGFQGLRQAGDALRRPTPAG